MSKGRQVPEYVEALCSNSFYRFLYLEECNLMPKFA